MKKNVSLFVVLLFATVSAFAQLTEQVVIGSGYLFPQHESAGGSAVVVQDARLGKLTHKYINYNRETGKMKGWRVQIYFSSELGKARSEAEAIKKEFDKKYPEVKSYLKYEAPFFYVKVGDFRRQSDALKFRSTLQYEYQSAFLVRDDIEFPELD